MDSKTLAVLEYAKILERLAAQCDFSASAELARTLEPTASYELAKLRLQETTEARHLLSVQDVSIGGAHDVREKVKLAARGGVLDPVDLLDVKSTLISCRQLKRILGGKNEPKAQAAADKAPAGRRRPNGRKAEGSGPTRAAPLYPRLGDLSLALPETHGVVDAISRTLSDKGEVLDGASPRLASLRAELRVAHERLMSRLQRYLGDSKTAQMLQDTIITQRDGRYVIPLRSEFKGQIKAIVHDQSASGATLFVEPLAVVELNNTYKEIQLAERDEVRRVLAEVSTQVGAQAVEIVSGVDALAEIDLAFAKAKYAEELHGSEPILVERTDVEKKAKRAKADGEKAEAVADHATLKLLQARHPLLGASSAIANDIDLAPGTRAVVITGPNTGGKTVSLKTVGLLVVMAQSGLHIPARSGSELSLFRDVFADIGDEQSIEQSLSTFSGHITNIIRILKRVDARTLVILDELGAGTDPQEGAALARAILQHLLDRGCTTFVATHYPELKTFAHSVAGVVNASLEFDLRTLRPTYKLTLGLPGRSNALAIAARLGLPDGIIAAAKSEVHPDNLRADKLLDDIRKERNRTSREREKTEKARHKTDVLNQELEQRLEKIEDERREVLSKARAEGELEVEVLKRNIQSLRSQLKKLHQPLDALEKIEEKVDAVEEKVQQPVARRASPEPSAPQGAFKLGERVVVSSLGSEGIISALSESEAEVQVGSLRVRAKLVDLVRKTASEERKTHEGPAGRTRRIHKAVENLQSPSFGLQPSPGIELDLRGQASEEALSMLDDYLDKAYLAGMPFVRIIHGKGTGKLRQVVRTALKEHPQVTSFESGLENEGGDGVTVAKMEK